MEETRAELICKGVDDLHVEGIVKKRKKGHFKTWQFNNFGGDAWFKALVAFGEVSDEFIDCYNQVIKDKVVAAGREPTRQPWHRSDSTLSKAYRSSVAPRRRTNPCWARKRAKEAERPWRNVHDMNDRWAVENRARCPRNFRDLEYRLKDEADALWAEAEQMSTTRSRRWQDRDGTMQNYTDTSVFNKALELYFDGDIPEVVVKVHLRARDAEIWSL